MSTRYTRGSRGCCEHAERKGYFGLGVRESSLEREGYRGWGREKQGLVSRQPVSTLGRVNGPFHLQGVTPKPSQVLLATSTGVSASEPEDSISESGSLQPDL